MTEILAVLTVAFAVYVLYEVFKTVSQSSDSQSGIQPKPTAQAPTPAPAPVEQPKAAAAPKSSAQPTAAKAATPAAAEEKTIILRDPASGETTPVPTNYRFAKKWIKEALVAEGLLKKVYKNSELTGAANNTVKDALEKFKNIEKYQA